MKRLNLLWFVVLLVICLSSNVFALTYEGLENYIENCIEKLDDLSEGVSDLNAELQNTYKNEVAQFKANASSDFNNQEDTYGEESNKYSSKNIKADFDKLYKRWTDRINAHNSGKVLNGSASTGDTSEENGKLKTGYAHGKASVWGDNANANINMPKEASLGVAGGSSNNIETAVSNGVLVQEGSRFAYMINGQKFTNGYVKMDIDANFTPEYYYFDKEGFLLVNGKTPEGYNTNAQGQCIDAFSIKIGESNPNAVALETSQPKSFSDLPQSILSIINSAVKPLDRDLLKGKLREEGWETADAEGMISYIDWNKEALKFANEQYKKKPDITEENLREKLKKNAFTSSEINYAISHAIVPDLDDDEDDE